MAMRLRSVLGGALLLLLAWSQVSSAGETISALQGISGVVIEVYVDTDPSLAGMINAEVVRGAISDKLSKSLASAGIPIRGQVDHAIHYPPDMLMVVLGVDMLPGPQQVIVDMVVLESFRYVKTEVDPKKPMFIQCSRSAQYGGYSPSLLGAGIGDQVDSVVQRFLNLYSQNN
jgi:hypothetical protein